jgi:hypothetical protein
MKLIREFTEFNNQRMNADTVPQSTHVDNPSLSMGSYNRYEMNLKSSFDRLNNLYKNIAYTTTGLNLKTGSTVEGSDLKNIKILRIYPKNDIYLDVYFTFEIEGEEYYGVINKLNSTTPEVKSEIFRDRKIFQTKEWTIRIKGNLIKSIKKWMEAEPGKYKSLKDVDAYNENTGELTLIPINQEIELIRSLDNKMVIKYMDNNYNLVGRNYYYFNYYFHPMF